MATERVPTGAGASTLPPPAVGRDEQPGADWSAWTAARRREIDALLSARLDQLRTAPDPGRLVESMAYSLLAPGKRLRPLLALAAAEAAGDFLDDNVRLAAAAVELVHCYSLIHDDLPAMDDDDFRRGKPSNHKAFDEATAILAGDALLTLAFEWLADGAEETGRPRAFARAAKALARGAGASGMVRGQARDLSSGKPGSLDALELLHAEKTGALFQAAVEVGAWAAGASHDDVRALGTFGAKLGVAFQHADDLDDADHPDHASVARARKDVLLSEAVAHLDQLRLPERAGALRAIAADLRGR